MSIVEKMARAMWDRRFGNDTDPHICTWESAHSEARDRFTSMARAALTATGLTEDQLEGLANGTHYIIERPRFDEGPRHASDDSRFGEPSNDEVRRAMLAAKEG